MSNFLDKVLNNSLMLLATEAREDVIDQHIYATNEAIYAITKSLEQMRRVLKDVEETPPK